MNADKTHFIGNGKRFGIKFILMFTACLLLSIETQHSVLGQVAVRNQGYVPFSEEPINYRSSAINDPVYSLQQQLNRGEVKLVYEPGRGYLRSVLELLDIPVSSQSLVFSKTSFQFRHISPQQPRALYFNDDVYVGWVRDGKVIEIISFDQNQGAIFYILDEKQVEKPVFERAELDCTQCHVVGGTRNVPGVLVRSIYPRATGTQAIRTSSYITGHESPWNERFGGWYVTGSVGNKPHIGNSLVIKEELDQSMKPVKSVRIFQSDLSDLTGIIDTAPYLSPHSDVVAQLVQAHQTQMHNLITLTNYQTRLAIYSALSSSEKSELKTTESLPLELTAGAIRQIEGPAEELVRYLLFANEPSLPGSIRGSSTFATEFAARGPRDQSGRSLRDFDLRRRLFKYPCSYLIYSKSFDTLPEPAKSYVYRRLLEILTGRDQSPTFAHLSTTDRRAILEILLATKSNLPEYWKRNHLLSDQISHIQVK